MKKSAKVQLYFGLDCGNGGIFYLWAAIQRTIGISPAFVGARFGEKYRGLSTCKPWTEQAGGLETFLDEASQNFEVVLNIQAQN